MSKALLNEMAVEHALRIHNRVEDGSDNLWELRLAEGARDEFAESVCSLDHQTIKVPHEGGSKNLDAIQSLDQHLRLARLRSDVKVMQASDEFNLLVLERFIVKCVGRRREVESVNLWKGQMLVFVLVGAIVDEAQKSPNSLRIENERNGSLEVYEQSVVQPRTNTLIERT